MDDQNARGRSKSLAGIMKAIGYLTNPETLTGKAFTSWERGMSGVMDKLARNDTYLNLAGGMMNRSFRMQSAATRRAEETLHAMRMPTSSDINDMRAEIRRLNDQVEAMSAQLELVIEALERER